MGKFLTVFLSGILVLSAGCTTIQELPKHELEQELATPEQAYCRELLICFLKNDGEGFIGRLSEESQKTFTKEEFDASRKAVTEAMGEPVSFRYLTTLEFTALRPLIWTVCFEKTGRGGKKIRSEALFRITTGRDPSGKVLVLGFNFL